MQRDIHEIEQSQQNIAVTKLWAAKTHKIMADKLCQTGHQIRTVAYPLAVPINHLFSCAMRADDIGVSPLRSPTDVDSIPRDAISMFVQNPQRYRVCSK